jgi:quinol-cytochrome oxidoreductase complex cytochrome b subunit
MAGLLGFFLAILATVVAPIILPALIVQAIRVKSRGFVLAAVLGVPAYVGLAAYILITSWGTKDPAVTIGLIIFTRMTLLLLLLGVIVALIAAWQHTRKLSAN